MRPRERAACRSTPHRGGVRRRPPGCRRRLVARSRRGAHPGCADACQAECRPHETGTGVGPRGRHGPTGRSPRTGQARGAPRDGNSGKHGLTCGNVDFRRWPMLADFGLERILLRNLCGISGGGSSSSTEHASLDLAVAFGREDGPVVDARAHAHELKSLTRRPTPPSPGRASLAGGCPGPAGTAPRSSPG